jgi:hypothetical protein
MHRWLVLFALGSFTVGCSSGGDNAGIASGGNSGNIGQQGCSIGLDCSACSNCYSVCVCTTGDSEQCKPACGLSSSGGTSGWGSGGASSGGASSGGASGSGAAGGTTSSGTLAAGLRITEVAVYQAVKVPIMQQGTPVSNTNAPVVAGRDALVRVFVTPDAGYQAREIVARLELPGSAPLELSKAISGPSSDSALASTFNFSVPGAQLPPGASYSVSLLEAQSGAPGGSTDGARFPAQGEAPIGAQSSNGPLKVVLVPMVSNGYTPDTTPSKIEFLRKRLLALYPVPSVELSMRQAVSTVAISGNGSGFNSALDTIINLRQQDKASFNAHYYGLLAPAASANQFCGYGGCVAGLSVQATDPNSSWGRASIGLGYFPDGSSLDAPGTMAHEIGHANGLPHAPCKTQDAGQYPYAGGAIGVWGYDAANQKLLDPISFKDVMGYCDPDWISDFNFKRIFTRLAFVNSKPYLIPSADPERAPGRFRTATLGVEGKLVWGSTLQIDTAQSGEFKQVELLDASGAVVEVVAGFFYPFNHIDGGMLFVREQLIAHKPNLSAIAATGLGTLKLAH